MTSQNFYGFGGLQMIFILSMLFLFRNSSYLCSEKPIIIWIMTYLNQFHKEVTERKIRKIAESQQSPMSSTDFANYMKRNLELAKQM